MTAAEQSIAERLASLAARVPNGAERVAEMLAGLTLTEAAALAYDWEGFWCRPKQAPPATNWRTFGFLGGRGMGKTIANTQIVQREIEAGRAPRVALIAQSEERAIEVLVEGASGLCTISPPWFRAKYEAGRIVYPNGAQCFIYSPERPGDIFGPEHHLALAEDLHAWVPSKREEAFANLRMGLRLGYGRLLWGSNPARRHPILRELLADAEADPARNIVVRGTSLENRHHLTPGIVDEWIRKYGTSRRGREMIFGEQFEDDGSALFRQEWIDRARRDMPSTLRRRILSVDPAISGRVGTDRTGIVDLGLGVDEQVYVIENLTGRYAPETWGALLIDRYFRTRADCVVFERNRGGDLVVAVVRACAKERGITVQVVDTNAPTRHVGGVIYAKETHARRSKDIRAEPVAALYERGQVSHVRSADLSDLEDTLTTWSPEQGGASPDALDALVHGVFELGNLGRETKPSGAAAVSAAAKMMEELMKRGPRTESATNVAALFGGEFGGGRRGGDRI